MAYLCRLVLVYHTDILLRVSLIASNGKPGFDPSWSFNIEPFRHVDRVT